MSKLLQLAVMMGATIAAVMAVWLVADVVAIGPLRAQAQRAEVASETFETLAIRRAGLERELSVLALPSVSGVLADPRFDQSANATAGLQTLQEVIRAALAEAGGIPSVTQSATVPIADGLSELRVLLKAQLTEEGLMSLLRDLGSASPQITVDQLEMQMATREGSSLDATLVLSAVHIDAP